MVREHDHCLLYVTISIIAHEMIEYNNIDKCMLCAFDLYLLFVEQRRLVRNKVTYNSRHQINHVVITSEITFSDERMLFDVRN